MSDLDNRIEELARAFESLMKRSGKFMEEFSDSWRGELFILKYLFNHDTSITPSELSEALQSSTARISAILGKLEKKGQIYREIDTSNRRNILVTITDEGRERVQSSVRQMRRHLVDTLAEMGEADAAEFIRLLTAFFSIIQRSVTQGAMPCGRRFPNS